MLTYDHFCVAIFDYYKKLHAVASPGMVRKPCSYNWRIAFGLLSTAINSTYLAIINNLRVPEGWSPGGSFHLPLANKYLTPDLTPSP